VFVSHDRYFLDGLATRVLEVGNQIATAYLGNYEDYLAKKSAEEQGRAAQKQEEPAAKGAPAPAEVQDAQRSKKKVNPFKIQKLTGQIEEIEGNIQAHETRIAVLAQMLSTEELYRDY